MSDSSVIDAARRRIRPALRAAVGRLDRHNRAIAEYHLGFADETGAPSDADSGKMVRGALALLSARASSTSTSDAAGDAAGGAALAAAVGIELVHQYSLLHDDIIDGDKQRRYRPTAWTVFGTERAILAGDAMAALAIEIVLDGATRAGEKPGERTTSALSRTPTRAAAAEALTRASRRMVAGQAADLAFESATAVTVDAALAMVGDKTGALIECAASIGAIAAGAPGPVVDGLIEFGRQLGVAFQVVDDVMGLWGDPRRTGKPVGSDVVSRKRSLPVVVALASGSPHVAGLAERYADPRPLDSDEVASALEAIDAAGGRLWAQAEADRRTSLALAALDALAIDESLRADLRNLTIMLCHRDR